MGQIKSPRDSRGGRRQDLPDSHRWIWGGRDRQGRHGTARRHGDAPRHGGSGRTFGEAWGPHLDQACASTGASPSVGRFERGTAHNGMGDSAGLRRPLGVVELAGDGGVHCHCPPWRCRLGAPRCCLLGVAKVTLLGTVVCIAGIILSSLSLLGWNQCCLLVASWER